MKKIFCSVTSRSDILDRIRKRFDDVPGCNVISIQDVGDRHCSVVLKISSISDPVTITVWYDYKRVKDGFRKLPKKLSWNSSYTIDASGHVYDSAGNLLGHVEIITDEFDSRQKYRFDYDIESIRTDSGDVLIDHPEKANCYQDVVESLKQRSIVHRS